MNKRSRLADQRAAYRDALPAGYWLCLYCRFYEADVAMGLDWDPPLRHVGGEYPDEIDERCQHPIATVGERFLDDLGQECWAFRPARAAAPGMRSPNLDKRVLRPHLYDDD